MVDGKTHALSCAAFLLEAQSWASSQSEWPRYRYSTHPSSVSLRGLAHVHAALQVSAGSHCKALGSSGQLMAELLLVRSQCRDMRRPTGLLLL